MLIAEKHLILVAQIHYENQTLYLWPHELDAQAKEWDKIYIKLTNILIFHINYVTSNSYIII